MSELRSASIAMRSSSSFLRSPARSDSKAAYVGRCVHVCVCVCARARARTQGGGGGWVESILGVEQAHDYTAHVELKAHPLTSAP